MMMLADDSNQHDMTPIKEILSEYELISFGNDPQTLGQAEWFKQFPDNITMKNCGVAWEFLNDYLKKQETESKK